ALPTTPGCAQLAPAAPSPLSFGPCWLHTLPLRVNTHAAPIAPLSPGPPTMAVLPSPDSATDQPSWAAPVASLAVVLCGSVQLPPLRVNIHAAPASLLSDGPPTIAVLPSAETATAKPCPALPTASPAESFGTVLCAVAGCVSSTAHSSRQSRAIPRA